MNMNELVEKLKIMALKASEPDASTLEAAAEHIEKLEAKLYNFQEDVTDWKNSVERQMKRRRDL